MKANAKADAGTTAPGNGAGAIELTRPGGDSGLVFWPQWWRIFLLSMVTIFPVLLVFEAIIFAAAGWSSNWANTANWLFLVGFPVVVSAVLAMLFHNSYPITVTETLVVGLGPGEGAWRRESAIIFIDDLDRVRSAQRSWRERLFGWQRLYSQDGRSIYFYRAAFDPADVRRLLGLLNIPE